MQLASGGKNGCVFIWDVRSPKVPLSRYKDAQGVNGTIVSLDWVVDTSFTAIYCSGSSGTIAQYILTT